MLNVLKIKNPKNVVKNTSTAPSLAAIGQLVHTRGSILQLPSPLEMERSSLEYLEYFQKLQLPNQEKGGSGKGDKGWENRAERNPS